MQPTTKRHFLWQIKQHKRDWERLDNNIYPTLHDALSHQGVELFEQGHSPIPTNLRIGIKSGKSVRCALGSTQWQAFRNPLNFYNPIVDPHINTERDFSQFVAFGMMFCYSSLMDDALDADTHDVYCLRKNFLEELQLVFGAMSKNHVPETPTVNYCGKHAGFFPVVQELHTNQNLSFQWLFDSLHRNDGHDGSLLFVLNWGERKHEDFSCWLSLPAVMAPHGQILKNTFQTIGQARKLNEKLKGNRFRKREGN